MIIRFGDFSLDTEGYVLSKGVEPVALEPQVFDVLRYLAENRDRVVSKDELIENIWDGRVVSDAAITSSINLARRAVEDDGKVQGVIKTFPRRGFRFVAELKMPDGPENKESPAGSPDQASETYHGTDEKPSIAVLPFENMSKDPEQEYFSDGISEDIITGLSRFHWFFVIARNSSFIYKGGAVDVRQVAQELGVQYILEGSVRKVGDRIRITALLVEGSSGHHVWADRYDRSLDDIFAVQDEITEAIVVEVAPSFISAEARRVERKTPESLDAWDYAMRGNWHLSQRSIDDLSQAKTFFEKSLELDPKSTLALGGLTITIGWLINFGRAGDIDEARKAGYAAARRAIDLDNNDAWGHMALGIISFSQHDLDMALSACRRSVQLNPNLALAEGWLGVVLSWRGEYDEAILHATRAQQLSPNDPILSMWSFAFTGAVFGAGRYEDAAHWAKTTLEVTPGFPAPWRYLAASLAHLGRLDEAKEAKEQLMKVMPNESIKLVLEALPSVEPDRMNRFVEGLRLAGVPETS